MISKINFSLKATLAALAISLGGLNLCLEGAPVHQFTFTGDSQQINLGCDNSGNAIAVLVDGTIGFSEVVYGSYYTGGTWSPLVPLASANYILPFFPGNPPVAMDASGTALTLWSESPDGVNTSQESAFFTPSVWTTPTPSPVETNFSIGSVAMDGLGQGLGLWTDLTNLYARFYSGGAWAPSVAIGGAGNRVFNNVASYSSSGNASAVWSEYDFGLGLYAGVYANNYDGSTWLGVQTLDALDRIQPYYLDAGIDALGNTIAIWVTGASDDVVTSTYSGGVWSSPLTIATGGVFFNTGGPRIAVAPGGTAVVVWTDSGFNVQMATYDGSTWSGPFLVQSASNGARVAIDSNGNAVIGWFDETTGPGPYNIYFARLPSGGSSVDNVTFLGASMVSNFSLEVAISAPNQTAFAVWNESFGLGEASNTFGTYYQFVPPPPTGFIAQLCTQRETNQFDCDNIITWDPSTDPDVVSYNLYKNAVFVANFLITDPLTYTDAGVPCGQINTYTIEAVNNNGATSPLAASTVDICSPSPCG